MHIYMGRRYRKKSASSSILSDSAYIGSRLPWWGALFFGLISFIVFYFIIPMWLESKLHESQSSNLFPALEVILGRRMHWFQWLGLACGLIGLFFTVRNYLVSTQAGYQERSLVSIIARLLSRNIE